MAAIVVLATMLVLTMVSSLSLPRGSPSDAHAGNARHGAARTHTAQPAAHAHRRRDITVTPFTRAQAAQEGAKSSSPPSWAWPRATRPTARSKNKLCRSPRKACPECTSIKPVLARIYGNSRIDYRRHGRARLHAGAAPGGRDNFFDDA